MFHKCSLASSHYPQFVTGFCNDARLLQQLLSASAANAPQPQPPQALRPPRVRRREQAVRRCLEVQSGCRCPRPGSPPGGGGYAPLPAAAAERPAGSLRGKEGGTPALSPPGAAERRWGWGAGAALPTLGSLLATAFPTSVSRNRKVPVQLSPHKILSPSPRSLSLPLPASGPCERSRFSPCGTGLSRWGQPARRRGMGTGLWGPSGRAQSPTRS